MPISPACILLDNGSLNPAATLGLRRIASNLSTLTGREVRPVSLLHSSSIASDLLNGRPAEIFEPFMKRFFSRGVHEFLILPLFIGPSRSITDYLPGRIRSMQTRYPELNVRIAPCLAGDGISDEHALAEILYSGIEAVIQEKGLRRASVILVDHGTPTRAVNAVRQRLLKLLKAMLNGHISHLAAASMECREGPQYKFNEPLLENLLERDGYNRGDIVISMLFLLPGMHAGPGGDIENICAQARKRSLGMRTHLTPLLGENERLIRILEKHLQTGLSSTSLQ